MIPTVTSLKIKNKNYKINSELDCTSSGIYVAVCSTTRRAFKIVFVDKVGSNLSQQEDFWKQKLQSSINRCNILLPSITY